MYDVLPHRFVSTHVSLHSIAQSTYTRCDARVGVTKDCTKLIEMWVNKSTKIIETFYIKW
jgi:hypothetical protein